MCNPQVAGSAAEHQRNCLQSFRAYHSINLKIIPQMISRV
jgi:hypothetical protein